MSRHLTSVVFFGDVGLQDLYMQIKEIFLGLFPGTRANWRGIVRFLLLNLLASNLCSLSGVVSDGADWMKAAGDHSGS